MNRRAFLKKASIGAALAPVSAIAAPAVVTGGPSVEWRLGSSFPKSLDAIYGGAEVLAKRVHAATGGRFNIKVGAAGEFAPALGLADAVEKGDLECAHTCAYYYGSKDPAWLIGTTMPFGMNFRQVNAWLYFGGGQELLNEYFAKWKIISFAGGNTGVQMGWSKKRLRTLDDIKGLKIRIAGMGGEIFRGMGAEPIQTPAGDIVSALNTGKIDAAEWVGPYDDEKIGLHKVAKYYYYPGFWETATTINFFVNADQWAKLPKEYQEIFIAATHEANQTMMAKYDYENPKALARILKEKVVMERFDDSIMNRAFGLTGDILATYSAKSTDFKKILASYQAFAKASNIWNRFAEGTLASYMGGTR
jgi:TRAP-type mannitol/chloroaromatic compound transport system substrate-binding protein